MRAFVSRVSAALPATSWGVRAAGDPDAPVSRVAVCGGAGDSLLDAVAAAGVQAYVTADLRHHPADEHRRASDVALVDVAHWASEFPWCGQAADLLRSLRRIATGAGVPDPHRPLECRETGGRDDDESRSRTATFAARSWPSSTPSWPRSTTGPATCPSSSDSSGCRPSTVAANDRLAALQIALEDLDAQVSRFESEIDAVRQREDRDRSLLQSGAQTPSS